jgi:hypothetical protein
MKKLAINPSSQMHNVGVVDNYIEGTAMLNLGQRMQQELERMGAASAVFWSGRGDRLAGLTKEVDAANKYGADYFVSLHSDSAGDRHGVMVGYYYSDAGKRLAYALLSPVCKALGLTFQLRSNRTFYVLKHTHIKKEEKERRVHMQHGKKHYLTILPQDNHLYISNTDDDTEIHVARKFYDEHGKRLTATTVVVPPHETWGMNLGTRYGLMTLVAMGAFTSRVE